MDPELLRDHLNRLHEELRQVREVDPRSSELLSEVLQDIQRVLARPSDAGGARPVGSAPDTRAAHPGEGRAPGMPGRLERLAVQFEADHPTLAESTRRLIDLLGKAGL
jgi:hypothetical protein